jgi:hypothetical protein
MGNDIRTNMNFTKTVSFWGWLFILFFSFSLKATLVASFPTHLMLHFSTKLDKIFTQTMTWHITTPQRRLLWHDKHHNDCGTAPKLPIRPNFFYNKSDSQW